MKILPFIFVSLACLGCRTVPTEKTPGTSTTEVGLPDATLVKNNNRFAFELYNNIGSEPQNMFCSPYSISAALAMTYTGAREKTEKQMNDVFHFGTNDQTLYNKYHALFNYINGLNAGDMLNIYTANSIWAQKDFKFKTAFIDNIKNSFNSEVKTVDFIKETEKCRTDINAWVEQQTNQKIKDLIQPHILDDLTRLVLVNAIYFKAAWDMPFDVKATKKIDFYMDETTKITTDFMVADNTYKLYQGDTYKAIELPYGKGKMSMLLILPNSKTGLKELQKNLNVDFYNDLETKLASAKAKLYLPKFNTSSAFELSEVLKKMGMPEAFTDNADFSGMTGRKDLKISKVIHKTFINVDEAGTEAAAATAVVVSMKSVLLNMVEFKFDHPFMFIIKENTYNSVLFAGNIYNPTK